MCIQAQIIKESAGEQIEQPANAITDAAVNGLVRWAEHEHQNDKSLMRIYLFNEKRTH